MLKQAAPQQSMILQQLSNPTTMVLTTAQGTEGRQAHRLLCRLLTKLQPLQAAHTGWARLVEGPMAVQAAQPRTLLQRISQRPAQRLCCTAHWRTAPAHAAIAE